MLHQAHPETLELTKTYHLARRQGTLRVLGFRNVAPMATYRSAVALGLVIGQQPDLESVRRDGHTKVGFGLNAKQEISKNVGLFARASYNDGKNET